MLRFWVGVLVSFYFWLPILLIGNGGGYVSVVLEVIQRCILSGMLDVDAI